MAKTITTMRDSNGNDIPLKYVSKYDKAKDKAVRKVLARFLRARELLEGVVAETIAELDALAKTKESVGEKGNFSARSFDGLIQVSIRQQYNIFLDERVVKARELMLGYVEKVLAKVGGNDAQALRLIVAEAFKANAQGFLSTRTGARRRGSSRIRSSRRRESGISCASGARARRRSSARCGWTSRIAGRRRMRV